MKHLKHLLLGWLVVGAAALLMAAPAASAASFRSQSLLGPYVSAVYKPDGLGVTNLDSLYLLPLANLTNGSAYLNTHATNVATINWTNSQNSLRYAVIATNITYTGALTSGVTAYDTRYSTNGYVVVQNSYKNLLGDASLWADANGAPFQTQPGAASTAGTNFLYNICVKFTGIAATNTQTQNFRFSALPDGVNEATGSPALTLSAAANGTTPVVAWLKVPGYFFGTVPKVRFQSVDATALSTTNDAIWIHSITLNGFAP
jgi:hypothetical protein